MAQSKKINSNPTSKSHCENQCPSICIPFDDGDGDPPQSNSISNNSWRNNKKIHNNKRKSEKQSNGGSPPSPGGYPFSLESESDGKSISLNDSTPNDNLWENFLQELMKSAKKYKIKKCPQCQIFHNSMKNLIMG